MTYRLLSFTLAATFFLAATAYAYAGSLSAGSRSQATTTSPSSAQPSPSGPATAAPSNPPQMSQPSATADTKPLTNVPNAERKLVSAKVQDMLGRPIGQVQSVGTGPNGKLTSVQVALNTPNQAGKTVQFPADKLRYDARSGVVVAQVTQTEIDAMPATSSQPGAINQPRTTAPSSPMGTTPPSTPGY